MKKLSALLVVLLALVFSSVSLFAAANIADPDIPAGWHSLFAGLAPGEHIKAGTPLTDGCTFTEVTVVDGTYFNRSIYGPYAIGVPLKLAITCAQPISGIAAHGDQDHEPKAQWCFDSDCTWQLAMLANGWQYHTFSNVSAFTVTGGGDSAFIAILMQDAGDTDTATPTPEITPEITLTPEITPTPDGDTDIATPTPVATPTPEFTSTPTATPDGDTDTATPTATATDVPTGLEEIGEPWVFKSRVFIANVGK